MSAQSQLIQSQSSSPEPDAQSPSNSICADSNKLPLSWQQAMTLLDTIPGVARQSAQLLLAEVGTDMQRFPTAAHLCKWAGICPGNHESAGKQYSGKTPPRNRWLRGMLVQMANAAVCCKTSYFACVYRRLAARRGHKRAVIAVAHRLLIAVYHMLRQHQPYRDYRTTVPRQHAEQQLVKNCNSELNDWVIKFNLSPLLPLHHRVSLLFSKQV